MYWKNNFYQRFLLCVSWWRCSDFVFLYLKLNINRIKPLKFFFFPELKTLLQFPKKSSCLLSFIVPVKLYLILTFWLTLHFQKKESSFPLYDTAKNTSWETRSPFTQGQRWRYQTSRSFLSKGIFTAYCLWSQAVAFLKCRILQSVQVYLWGNIKKKSAKSCCAHCGVCLFVCFVCF